MPKYLIERDIPNAGALSPSELQASAKRSCSVLQQLGPSIQWIHSYVTEDKLTCIYIAPDAEIIREHARLGGFPADKVLEIAAVIDPTTAEVGVMAEVNEAA
jgi:cell division inhibitor SulA